MSKRMTAEEWHAKGGVYPKEVLWDWQNSHREMKELNAELLDALKAIDKMHKNRDWIDWNIVEQAIAKAEGDA